MPWGAGNLLDNPEFRRIATIVEQLRTRQEAADRLAAQRAAAAAAMNATINNRFRIGVKNVGLSLLGTITVDFTWSSPLPSATYKVDVACSALLGMPTVTVTNQTAAGCTVSFAPGLASTNATVIALAIAPATT